MVNTKNSRLEKFRSISGTTQASRPKNSVPPPHVKRSQWFDYVEVPSLKRKHSSSQKDGQVASVNTRTLRPRPSQEKLSVKSTSKQSTPAGSGSKTASARKVTQPVRNRARTTSPSPPPSQETVRGRARKPMSAWARATKTGLLTPTLSSEFTGSAVSKAVRGTKNATKTRISLAVSGGKTKSKGKATAPARTAKDSPPPTEADDTHASERRADEAGSARGTKRRRISSPAISLTSSDSSSRARSSAPPDVHGDGEDDALSDFSFHMLDIPDVAAFSFPPEPSSTVRLSAGASASSLYVPPGVGHLIDNMKHALEMESRARQNAEARLAEELQRRRDAERVAAQLAEENRALKREARAWSSAAAETFADAFAQAFVAGISPSHAGGTAPQLQAALHDIEQNVPPPPPDAKGKGRMVDPDVEDADMRESTPMSMSDQLASPLERPNESQDARDQLPPIPVPNGSEER